MLLYNDYIGDDYDSRQKSVVIPAGQTNVKFNVSITDDVIVEGNESFSLMIISELLTDQVTLGNFRRTQVTIVDNDGE